MPLFNKDSVSPVTDEEKDVTPRSSASSDASLIGAGVTVEGRIEGSRDLVVSGKVRGEIELSATVRIEKEGRVEATIRAAAVHVAGECEGSIQATRLLEIQPSAVVHGTISAPKLVIHEGAELNGRVTMRHDTQTRKNQENS